MFIQEISSDLEGRLGPDTHHFRWLHHLGLTGVYFSSVLYTLRDDRYSFAKDAVLHFTHLREFTANFSGHGYLKHLLV